jgi:hypothetical protein
MAHSSTLKLEAVCSSQTSVDLQLSTRRYVSEDNNAVRTSNTAWPITFVIDWIILASFSYVKIIYILNFEIYIPGQITARALVWPASQFSCTKFWVIRIILKYFPLFSSKTCHPYIIFNQFMLLKEIADCILKITYSHMNNLCEK